MLLTVCSSNLHRATRRSPQVGNITAPAVAKDCPWRVAAHIGGIVCAGFLLGSGGAGAEGGALARFIPERGERLRLITEAAHSCTREARTEEAVELFLYAGQPRPALHILNLQISELLQPALQDPSASAKLDAGSAAHLLQRPVCQLSLRQFWGVSSGRIQNTTVRCRNMPPGCLGGEFVLAVVAPARDPSRCAGRWTPVLRFS